MIPNIINSLQANDWKERQHAVDQFVDLLQLNPDGLGPKFTKVHTYVHLKLKELPYVTVKVKIELNAFVPPYYLFNIYIFCVCLFALFINSDNKLLHEISMLCRFSVDQLGLGCDLGTHLSF